MEGLWQHSLQTAVAARAIALHERLPLARAEEAFLAGMLHDAGRVVFATQSAVETGEHVNSEEKMAAHVDKHHAEVGAYLLGLWGFPSHIVAAVALHHRPSQRADNGLDLTALVHIADRLTHALGEQSPGPGELGLGIEPGLLEGLGLLNHLPQWAAAVGALASEQRAP